MRFINLSIKWHLVSICIFLTTFSVVIISIPAYYYSRQQMNNQIEESLQKQAVLISLNAKNTYKLAKEKLLSNLAVAKNVFQQYGKAQLNSDGEIVLIDTAKEKQVQAKVSADMKTAHAILYNTGRPMINHEKHVSVEAVHQITKEKTNIEIPSMEMNQIALFENYEIVDDITSQTGVETATLFQVIAQGLLRISTNVKKSDGTRAVRTYIPTTSPVYKTVMEKKTFYGRAFVVTGWYKTAYEPILDPENRVIGVLYVGAKERSHIVNKNFELVDKIKNQIGGIATVFQLRDVKSEPQNTQKFPQWPYDKAMVRVSTNVMLTDGTRAVGTIVSKPVYDAVMKKKTFYGRAAVVDTWYMTAYEPLKDSTGSIIGILSVGVKEEQFQKVLLKELGQLVVGKTGYVFILDKKGHYVLSSQHDRDGESIWDSRDGEGNYFIQEMIQTAETLKQGQSAIKFYSWKNRNETTLRKKVVGYAPFPEWEWIVAASAYVEDFADGLKSLRRVIVLATCSAILIGTVIAYICAGSISRPLNKVIGVLSSSSAEITTAVTQQESVIQHQASAVQQTNATMEELASSSRLSAQQAESAASGAQQVLELSEDGQQKMDDMVIGMDRLKEKVHDIANQILHLSEQTGKIGDITNLVSNFANETKMLAMNAAVEAVRAGEHGKGFSVLSVEIRKLADESKRSAERISTLVTEIRKVTNTTVMATEEGTKNVELGAQLARSTSDTFNNVSQAIGQATQNTKQISLNVQQQAIAVKQVMEAMEALNQGAKENSSGIGQVKDGMQTLNDAAQTLKQMV